MQQAQPTKSTCNLATAGALDRQTIAVHTFGMMPPRDRLPYSSPFIRPPLKLPGKARMIVWSVVNIAEWGIARPMARQLSQPPMGQTRHEA